MFVDMAQRNSFSPLQRSGMLEDLTGCIQTLHGQHLLANLHSDCFRGPRKTKLDSSGSQRGDPQVHHWHHPQAEPKTDRDRRHARSSPCFDRDEPGIALSDLVRDVKSDSSVFINGKKWVRGKFNWQEGFGAFSYGRSQLDSVVKYIENQEEHHSRRTFKDEYLSLLKRFNVDYDDRYLFQWVEPG
jgi:hypothetical protein